MRVITYEILTKLGREPQAPLEPPTLHHMRMPFRRNHMIFAMANVDKVLDGPTPFDAARVTALRDLYLPVLGTWIQTMRMAEAQQRGSTVPDDAIQQDVARFCAGADRGLRLAAADAAGSMGASSRAGMEHPRVSAMIVEVERIAHDAIPDPITSMVHTFGIELGYWVGRGGAPNASIPAVQADLARFAR
jgi:hypothetical protein